VYLATGKPDAAEPYLKQILAEKYTRPNIGTYYQALAQRALKNELAAKTLLDSLEQRARENLSGKFEFRGDPEVIGRTLLALVLEARGDTAGAAREHSAARERNPQAMRLATRQAQLEYARAHQ
jgi:hypothetical protein